jgi:hypothetical protein
MADILGQSFTYPAFYGIHCEGTVSAKAIDQENEKPRTIDEAVERIFQKSGDRVRAILELEKMLMGIQKNEDKQESISKELVKDIITELHGRSGYDDLWNNLDPGVQKEIILALHGVVKDRMTQLVRLVSS